MTRATKLPAPLRLIKGTQFGLFFAGNGLSLVGSWMQRIACSWLVWDWTGSAFWVGVLAAGDLLPVVLTGPFAGVAADRWNRLRQNIWAQTASAALAVLMAVLLATGHLGLHGTVVLVTLQGTLVAAMQPSRLAMIQEMVQPEDLGTAVALNSVNVNLARLLGPAIAGAMILYVDIVWVFIANAIVTAIFVFVLTRLRLTAQEKRTETGSFFGEMKEGFIHVARQPALRLILLVLFCGGVLVRAMIELVPAIAAQTFSNAAAGLAIITASAAAGAVGAGLTVGRSKVERLLFGVLLWWSVGALAAFFLVRSSSPLMAIPMATMLGAAVTCGLVSTQTFVQLTTPGKLRGRVLSIHGLIARGSPALGALAVGFAADRIGLKASITTASALLMLVVLVLAPVTRRQARSLRELM
ncbi:MFS transporter [Martelella soudanensis]|uniref:MFS transporter n=1 Tax=unclassified Martelella TaxID=2629616 RepID=UPI001AEF0CE0|nr:MULTISPECIES: MFS transporter [unclassified Martelella]